MDALFDDQPGKLNSPFYSPFIADNVSSLAMRTAWPDRVQCHCIAATTPR